MLGSILIGLNAPSNGQILQELGIRWRGGPAPLWWGWGLSMSQALVLSRSGRWAGVRRHTIQCIT